MCLDCQLGDAKETMPGLGNFSRRSLSPAESPGGNPRDAFVASNASRRAA